MELKTVLVHLVGTVRVIYKTSWYGVELVVLLDQTYLVGLPSAKEMVLSLVRPLTSQQRTAPQDWSDQKMLQAGLVGGVKSFQTGPQLSAYDRICTCCMAALVMQGMSYQDYLWLAILVMRPLRTLCAKKPMLILRMTPHILVTSSLDAVEAT